MNQNAEMVILMRGHCLLDVSQTSDSSHLRDQAVVGFDVPSAEDVEAVFVDEEAHLQGVLLFRFYIGSLRQHAQQLLSTTAFSPLVEVM